MLGKDPDIGKCEGKRGRGRQRMRWLDNVIKATNMNLTQLREALEDRRAWRALVHGVTKSQIQFNNQTTTAKIGHCEIYVLYFFPLN